MDTIRNPIEWAAGQFRNAAHFAGSARHTVAGTEEAGPVALPRVRRISVADLRTALEKGIADFRAFRTDVVFLCLVYPLIGLLLWRVAFHYNLLPLIFPLAFGFAIVGPAAAVGLYEMSRRRERGEHAGWGDAFATLGSPSIVPILLLGGLLFVLLVLWLACAQMIYDATLGPQLPASLAAFLGDVFTTPAGWAMIALGLAVGAIFAVVAFAVSVVSFPLLVDREIGLYPAVITSVRAVAANPGPMALWALIVAGALVVGSLPLLVGLAVAVPVLGHATWHLYRRVIAAS